MNPQKQTSFFSFSFFLKVQIQQTQQIDICYPFTMPSSQEISHSPLQIDLKYRRLFKYHNNRKPNMELSPKKITSEGPSKTGLHFNGKINFHELLSVPLQKQIQMENKIKQNQTFFLKFETQSKKKSSKPVPRTIKGQNKNQQKNNKKLIIFTDKRMSLNSQRSERKSEDDLQKQGEFNMKDVSKTVYFKPLGKIIHSNSMGQNIERRSFQFERNSQLGKRDIDTSMQIGNHSPRDKLLMLLQIRRNQRIQKQNNCCYAKPSFSRYGNFTHRQFGFKSRFENKSDEENVQKSLRWQNNGSSFNKLRRSQQNKNKKQQVSNDEPTPWQLADHIEDF